MVISIEQRKCLVAHKEIKVTNCNFFLLILMLLLTHGNIESNPEPKIRISNYFSYCYWNVNRIMTHSKLSLKSAYNIIHKYDMICISNLTLKMQLIIIFY